MQVQEQCQDLTPPPGMGGGLGGHIWSEEVYLKEGPPQHGRQLGGRLQQPQTRLHSQSICLASPLFLFS